MDKENRQARRARERREAKHPGFAKSFASRRFVLALDSNLGPRMKPTAAAPEAGSPEAWIDTRYILFCRVEDDGAAGSWVLTGADSPEEGDWLARELQPMARSTPSMESRLSARCELVANTPEAITAWANHSVKRKRALAEYGETGGR